MISPIFCRAGHHRKSGIWRWNFGAICQSSRDVFPVLAAISTFPVVSRCCTYLRKLFSTYTWSHTPDLLLEFQRGSVCHDCWKFRCFVNSHKHLYWSWNDMCICKTSDVVTTSGNLAAILDSSRHRRHTKSEVPLLERLTPEI